jgi:hypothetical protein
MVKYIVIAALYTLSGYHVQSQERSRSKRDMEERLSLLAYVATLKGKAEWELPAAGKHGSLKCYFYCDSASLKDSLGRKLKANALATLLRVYVLGRSAFHYSKVMAELHDSTTCMGFFSEYKVWSRKKNRKYKDKNLRVRLLENALLLWGEVSIGKRSIDVRLNLKKSQIVPFSIMGERYASSVADVIFYLLHNGNRKRSVNVLYYDRERNYELWKYSY